VPINQHSRLFGAELQKLINDRRNSVQNSRENLLSPPSVRGGDVRGNGRFHIGGKVPRDKRSSSYIKPQGAAIFIVRCFIKQDRNVSRPAAGAELVGQQTVGYRGWEGEKSRIREVCGLRTNPLEDWTATYLLEIAYFSHPIIRRPRSGFSLRKLAVKFTMRKLESWGYYSLSVQGKMPPSWHWKGHSGSYWQHPHTEMLQAEQ